MRLDDNDVVFLLITDSRSIEDFNESFVAAWKTTHNYKQLQSGSNEALSSIPVGYMCTRLRMLFLNVSEVLSSSTVFDCVYYRIVCCRIMVLGS